MIAKILKKLGLGHLAYLLLAPVYSKKYGKNERQAVTVEEALALLHETSRDSGASSYVPRRSQEDRQEQACLDIIVPAYNVERYIGKCVESVLSQETSYGYRLIVIDDGSTDSTGDILDSYSGLTVIRQQNKGFSGARNRGLEMANAQYIMFLDSDDELCPGAVESLMHIAMETGAGIVEGGYTEVNTAGRVIRRHRHKGGRISPVGECNGYIWGKVIKRELFTHLSFPNNYWYQDSIVQQILCPLAEEQGYLTYGVENSVVLYRQNPYGITKKSRGSSKCLDSLYITMKLFEDRKTFGLPPTAKYYDYILSMAVQTYSRTRQQEDEVKRDIFIVYADFIESKFSGWHTENKKLACLEKAFREQDYGSYLAYCELH